MLPGSDATVAGQFRSRQNLEPDTGDMMEVFSFDKKSYEIIASADTAPVGCYRTSRKSVLFGTLLELMISGGAELPAH
jgi:hypothetical protein